MNTLQRTITMLDDYVALGGRAAEEAEVSEGRVHAMAGVELDLPM